MRYIRIPEPVQLIDPTTDAPVDRTVSFAESIRVVTSKMLAESVLDTLDLNELRSKLCAASPGDEVAIDDAWWQPLANEYKRLRGGLVAYLLAAAPHIRAVLDATTKPRPQEDRPAPAN